MNQVEEKISTSERDIEETAMTISYDKNIQEYLVTNEPAKRMQLFESIKNSMNYISSSNKNIYNIILVDNNNRVFSLYSIGYYDYLKELGSKYNYASHDFKKAVFSSAIRVSNNSETYLYAYMIPVFSTAEDAAPRTKIGTCIILNKIDDFQNTIKKISLSDNSAFLINDSSGLIIAANNTKLKGTMFKNLTYKIHDANYNIFTADKYSIIQKRKLEGINFQLVSIMSIGEITKEIQSLRNFGLVTGSVLALLLMFISTVFFSNIMRPVYKISAFLEAHNYISKRLNISEANEIGMLAVNINMMLDNMEDMTRKIVNTQSSLYELELSKKQAELSFLQSQINPHFLYNTLNCIQSMGQAYGSEEIVEISSAMIRIFRYSIKGGDYAKVKEEIECIKDYLNIMSLRYSGKFIIEIDIEEKVMEMKLVKMILQPIVENAIYHGLECKKGKGKLTVLGRMDVEGNICFEIRDDGKGIDEDTLKRINEFLENCLTITSEESKEFVSIGLMNINKRIKLYFGYEYGIDITSRQNEGTSVKVKFPALS